MRLKPYLKERLLCRNKEYLFCYDDGYLILKRSTDKRLIQKCKIHAAPKAIPLIERLMRYEPRAAVACCHNNFLYSDHGYIFNYSVMRNEIYREHKFLNGMNNPLSFCTRYDENEKLTDLLYGEYMRNSERKPVSVYRRKNDRWLKLYSFKAGVVLHIHNIFFDRYRNRYLILTGDANNESGIWEADQEFDSVRPIVKGLQKYRSCVAYPVPDGIYYATDTPLEQNYLYKLTENDGECILTEIYKMPGPCIFGRVVKDVLYMATSVEGDPEQGGRYMFSNKLGYGVKDRYVHIIRCENDDVSEAGKLRKDFLPMWLFQFGNAKFPVSDDGKVYVCPQSCRCECGTYVIDE